MPDARFQPLPGFRDFAPASCAVRNYIFDTWKQTAKRYGFVEWEAPTLESTELYLKKTGGELPTQLFRFQDQGERDVTLRPELTASLGRIAAGYHRDYLKPMKWFEIGSCFRYEKPQKGRVREFYQFNVDILGEHTTGADAELIALAIDCMRDLGFQQGDFIVRISDRHAWLQFARDHGICDDQITSFLGVVDKLERDRPAECQAKLDAFGLQRDQLLDFIANPPVGVSPQYDCLLEDLAARGLDSFVQLDLSIVRGLAYYTGLVFEIFDSSRSLRAIAGGGRYDSLIGDLSNHAVDMPATGFAMGDVVIARLIEQTPHAAQLMQQALAQAGCEFYVIQADNSKRRQVLQIVSLLSSQGYRVDMALSPMKVGAQFQRAERAGARFAIIVGSNDNSLEIKNMKDRSSEIIPTDQLSDKMASLVH